MPDLSDLREESGLVAKRMFLDLPDDEGATGECLVNLTEIRRYSVMCCYFFRDEDNIVF